MRKKPHWINVTGRGKGQKFMCSKCNGKCNCIAIGCADKYNMRNFCNYQYCPRCGAEMDVENPTMYVFVEKDMKEEGAE